MSKTYDYLFKIVLVGDSCVGKTCLFLRFADDTYNDIFQPTIGIEFKIQTVYLDGKRIKLQIWDTSGLEQFRTIRTAFYRGAQGFIIVDDVTHQRSFENVRHWLQEINSFGSADANRLLVGNKSDLTTKKVIEYNEAKAYAESLNIPFLEISAKDTSNVEHAFMTLVREINSRILNPPENNASINV